MSEAEWQHLGDDNWAFGVKVRGLVRVRLGEVHFDPDRGGWFWFVRDPVGLRERSKATTLLEAVNEVERVLGVAENG